MVVPREKAPIVSAVSVPRVVWLRGAAVLVMVLLAMLVIFGLFILGIGDVNTHADKNVPGNAGSTNEPTKPAASGRSRHRC